MKREVLFLVIAILLVPVWGQDKEQKTYGIDISHHNGKIKWELVPDVEFASP